MSDALVTSATKTLFDNGSSYGSKQAVGYAPFFAKTFTGTLGAAPDSNFNPKSGTTVMSNDIAGPHGEASVMKTTIAAYAGGAGSLDFGGTFIPDASWPNVSTGETVWVRMYQYFPASFCAGYSTAVGGSGFVKWLRLQWGVAGVTAYSRATYQIGNISSESCNIAGPSTKGVTLESFVAPQNQWFASPLTIPRDQWVAIQFAMKIGSDGWIRGWMDNTFIGQLDIDTTPNTVEPLNTIVLGDYYNGGSHQENIFYTQDTIFTKEAPTTLDSGGRPFISPSVKAGDFI